MTKTTDTKKAVKTEAKVATSTKKLDEAKLAKMRASLRGTGSTEALQQYKVPGYYYRLVNTTDKQMARYKSMGYEAVLDKTGTTVRQDVGGGAQQILMRISNEEKAILTAIKGRDTANDVELVDPTEKVQADANYYQAIKNYNS